MTDEEIAKALDGKLGTHMLNGLFQELVDTHRNHRSEHGYHNLRKLMKALGLENRPMAVSELFVEHDNGSRGVIVGNVDQWHYKVVVCDTGEEASWHFQELAWLYLVPDRISEPPRV